MTHSDLIKGQAYTVRGTHSSQVGAVFCGRFGFELAFRTSSGGWWTLPVAYFQSAERAL